MAESPIPRIIYPWTPFPGAYMAPIPEVSPTSAIMIADQIPADLLRNIPADQREAYREQWPLFNAGERAIVFETYGAGRTEARKPEAPAVAPPANGGTMNNLVNQTTLPPEIAVRLPAGERVAYAADWPILSLAERQVLIDYAMTPAAPTQAGIGGAVLLVAAVGAWLLFGQSRRRRRRR